jgi:hypothetical protein
MRLMETHTAPPDSGLLEDWSVDSALAYYHEDGRIQAIEPVVDVAKSFANGQALNFNVTFDAPANCPSIRIIMMSASRWAATGPRHLLEWIK